MAIKFIHGGHDAVLEFLFGCDADMAQHGAGELGENALDEVEPGTMPGRESEFEATGGVIGDPGFCQAPNGSYPRFRYAQSGLLAAASGATQRPASQPSTTASPAWAASASDSRRVTRRMRLGVLRSKP